jgi:outer membrane protein assembly factor BamB
MKKFLPIIFTTLLMAHLSLGCILQPPAQYSGGSYPPKAGEESSDINRATAKVELIQALKDLKEKMATKIDIDVDNTAQTFVSVKDYWRVKRIADIIRAPLRVMEDTISLLAKAADLITLSQAAYAALDKSEAAYQALTTIMMVQDLQQVGENLHYGLDGPTYTLAIERMLEAADATFVPPMGDNWQKYYKQVIENYLYGPIDDSPLVIPRKSTTLERKNIEFAKSALLVRKSITQEFDKLIAEIDATELPEEFPTGQVVAQINDLKKQVTTSMVQGIDVRYKTYLDNQELYVDTRLGAIGEYLKIFANVALAVSKKLDIEIKVEVLKLAETGESAAMLYTASYGKPGATEFLKVTQKATVLPGVIISSYSRTFYTDSETEFYMIPQEIVLILPTELSNLWMIADDTDEYVRYLLKSTASTVSSTPATTNAGSASDWPMFRMNPEHTGGNGQVDAQRLALLWKYKVGYEMICSSPAVSGSRLFVSSYSYDDNIYCLGTDDGRLIWKADIGDQLASSPVVSGGKVFVGSDDKNIYCLDANDGRLLWKYRTGDTIYSSPAVDGGMVFVGSYDGNIYCLGVNNGTLIWKYKLGSPVVWSPAICGGKIFIPADEDLYCLNTTDGKFIWKYHVFHPTSPAVSGGKVFIGAFDRNIYCLDANDGTLIWKYLTTMLVHPMEDPIQSSPAISSGKLFIGADTHVYCLDTNNGTLIWKYEVGRPELSSPAVTGGMVWIGTTNGNIYCLGADNGSLIWKYKLEDSIDSSPTVSDGRVFVGLGSVYCFGTGDIGPFIE